MCWFTEVKDKAIEFITLGDGLERRKEKKENQDLVSVK